MKNIHQKHTLLGGSVLSGMVTTRHWTGSMTSANSQGFAFSAPSSKALCFSMLLAVGSTPFYKIHFMQLDLDSHRHTIKL